MTDEGSGFPMFKETGNCDVLAFTLSFPRGAICHAEALEKVTLGRYESEGMRKELSRLLKTASLTKGPFFRIVSWDEEGMRRWFELFFLPQQDDNGVSNLHVIGRDLTEDFRMSMELQFSENRYRNLIEVLQDGLAIFDVYENIIFTNPSFCEMLDYTEDELMGMNVKQIVARDSLEKIYSETDKRRKGIVSVYEVMMIRKGGEEFEARISAKPWLSPNGTFLGSMGEFQDISKHMKAQRALEASLNEKDVLLKEIHHRVKNNLQIVSSLLKLQSKNISNPEAKQVLLDSQNRIRSMALIHERLYRSKDLSRINIREYTTSLVSTLYKSMWRSGNSLNVVVDAQDTDLDIDKALSCGLIINELVSNSLKYAFDERGGTLEVTFKREGDRFVLRVKDDGRGLDDDLDIEKVDSLGLQLVSALRDQLRGELIIDNSNGACFELTFPAAPGVKNE